LPAAALALVLHAFALAIGLSVSSAAPTWRDTSFALVLLSGLYVVLAALASYGLGGYLAGLMHARASSREDADLRDGLHGLVWALATLLTARIGLATAQSLTRLATPSGGQAGPSTSVGGENLIAYDPRDVAAELATVYDRLCERGGCPTSTMKSWLSAPKNGAQEWRGLDQRLKSVWAAKLGKKSVDECAHILGIPAATVKTRMFYARKKLAELVKDAWGRSQQTRQGGVADRNRGDVWALNNAGWSAPSPQPLTHSATDPGPLFGAGVFL
jgi:hypothetical protein